MKISFFCHFHDFICDGIHQSQNSHFKAGTIELQVLTGVWVYRVHLMSVKTAAAVCSALYSFFYFL